MLNLRPTRPAGRRLMAGLGGGAIAGVLVAVLALTTLHPEAAGTDLRLVQAARRGDLAAVRQLIRLKVDLNAAEPDGATALLWAASRSNPDIVKALIAAGANVNVTNRYGLTPLLQAARLGQVPAVEALVAAGAKVDQAHPEGETPLMAAAAAGATQAVRLLIAKGANVNAREVALDQTALMWAAGEGQVEVVRLLLEAGADPNLQGKLTSFSRFRGDAGRMWVDFTSGGLTAAMYAAREGHPDVIRALADRKADLNVANPDGLTALLLAVINDQADAAMALLEKGAHANDGSLLEAVNLYNLRTNETVGELTRPRPRHDNATTPQQLIAALLARGADPMKMATHALHGDSTGQPQPVNQTAFQRALALQDVASLKQMVTKGANVNLVSDQGSPLMQLLGGGGRFGGGFGATPAAFRFPGERSAVEAAKVLIAAGADVNAARGNGDTALHLAAAAGNVPLIQVLADSGAKLEVKNVAGFTPLDAANGRGVAPAGRPGGPGPGPAAPQVRPEAVALLQKLMGAN